MVRAESLPQRGAGRDEWSIDRRARRRQWAVRGHRRFADNAPAERVRSSHAPMRPSPDRQRVMERLRDRVCLVTGSTGIAAASARDASPRKGRRCSSCRRNDDHCRVARRRDRRRGRSGRVVARPSSRTRPTSTMRSGPAWTQFGRIDGLFSVAGGSGRRFGDGLIHEVSGDAWDATLAHEPAERRRSSAVRSSGRCATRQPNNSGTRGSILLMGSVTATDPVARVLRDACVCGGQGGNDRTHDDNGRDLRSQIGIRVNAVAPSLTERRWRAGSRRRTDPRLRPPQAAAGRRDAGP